MNGLVFLYELGRLQSKNNEKPLFAFQYKDRYNIRININLIQNTVVFTGFCFIPKAVLLRLLTK
ncbi:hypothetical protein AZH43_10015 [Acinetobacter pragensis]|uniref:Uncharacterized protein n=1 Tax=Acinetobacter pragensis TaxID=1806892 RepID=A0A151Y391_9GAMM|nr:hypothetical protein AZH43_10015 [Acinetobacter pragensis]